jgi:hypothetical protein
VRVVAYIVFNYMVKYYCQVDVNEKGNLLGLFSPFNFLQLQYLI